MNNILAQTEINLNAFVEDFSQIFPDSGFLVLVWVIGSIVLYLCMKAVRDVE